MIGQICQYIKNYFTYEHDRIIGDWSVVNGKLVPSLDIPTDYYAIFGSRKNNGVHKVNDYGDVLVDEGPFHGSVWFMSPPQDFLDKVEEITAWIDTYGKTLNSPYTSESFGGYSYTKGKSRSGSDFGITWRDQFGPELKSLWGRARLP